MRLFFTLFFLSTFYFTLLSQTTLSGIVNSYTAVLEIEYCEGKLIIDEPTPFEAGQEVLLIQMKGATIDETNSSDFGDILDIGMSGLYEFNEIISINNNEVFLKNILINQYDISGLVQLISVPSDEEIIIEGEITGEPWNGTIGGIIAIKANNLLTLDSGINADGIGFRGGLRNIQSSSCNFLTNANDYHYSISNWRGAPKGEGVAAIIPGKEQGRGAQANGGGGGNDHNSGGGGGGNISAGGIGGEQDPPSNFGCSGDHPGRGGKVLPSDPFRAYLGGGGGSAHVDDEGAGSDGANGGGIVFIIANTIAGNDQEISAKGLTPPMAGGDGGGGGGAGGTILIDAQTLNSPMSIDASGGDGGDVTTPNDRCMGPGGGGAGGRVMTSLLGLTININAGKAGVNSQLVSQCNGISNEALAGTNGQTEPLDSIPSGNLEILPTAFIMEPASFIVCEGGDYTIETTVQGIFLNYQWMVDAGGGFTTVINDNTFSGANTPNLTISNVEADFSDFTFQLQVISDCLNDTLSLPADMTVIQQPIADFSFDLLGDGEVQFNNLSSNFDFSIWDFGDQDMTSANNPIHTYDTFGEYPVTLTVINDCDTVSTTQIVSIQTQPTADFSVPQTTGCLPLEVQFQNLSSENVDDYMWLFPGGTPSTSSVENPTITYNSAGNFGVTLIVSNTVGSDTMTIPEVIFVDGPPFVGFNFASDGLDVSFTNTTTNFTGDLFWEFGDNNSSNELNPEYTYPNEGIYEVTLTASNDCGSASITQEIATGAFPFADFTAAFNSDCAPVTVEFSDNSSGTNISFWDWDFPGGDPVNSNDPNPVVVYENPGVYDVSLTIVNGLGSNSTTFTDFVIVEPFPEADFEFIVNDFTVEFINTSTGGNFFIWDFGDGSPTSNESNPTHTFNSGGLYQVSLTAANNACASVVAFSIFIQPLSTEDVENNFSFSIYPNPVGDWLKIRFLQKPETVDHIQLLDLKGTLIQEKSYDRQEELFFNVENLPSGVYFLKMGNEHWQTGQKVIKH